MFKPNLGKDIKSIKSIKLILKSGWLVINCLNQFRVKIVKNTRGINRVKQKNAHTTINLYLFLMLTISSFSVFAGVDPDEIMMEDTETSQEIAKQDKAEAELVTKEAVKEVMQEIVTLTDKLIDKTCHSEFRQANRWLY